MIDSITIQKQYPLPANVDYEWLHKQGMAYIEALSHQLWNDYNPDDPGVTMVDVLCWALSEVGYKLSFDIADIIARLPKEARNDFYSAGKILTNNPTTILDLRKFVIDQPNVQNGWLLKHVYNDTTTQPAIDQPEFYYKCDDGGTKAFDIKINNKNYTPKKLNGLYNVLLQLEEHEEFGDLNANVVEWNVSNKNYRLKIVFPVIEMQFPEWNYPIAKILDYKTLTKVKITGITGKDEVRTIDHLIFKFDNDANKKIEFFNLKLVVEAKNQPLNSTIISELTNLTTPSQSISVFITERLRTIIATIKNVHCALHKVRNLCEDYVTYSLVRQQEILLCADIEVEPTADL